MWGELAADGEKRGKERAKGSSDGCGGRSQLSALPCGEGSGVVQGGNQFRVVCAGCLGCLFDKPQNCDLVDRCLFDKPHACNLVDRRLFDKPQNCDLVDRCLFDKPQTCNLVDRRLFDKPRNCDLVDRRLFDKLKTCDLVDRRLFDKYYTCNLADRRLFDKPRTRALINRCLFACGEFARSVSRGCLIAGIRERVGLHRGWPATGRLYGEGGACWGKTRLRVSVSPSGRSVRIKKVPRTQGGDPERPGDFSRFQVGRLLRLDVRLLEAEVVLLVDSLQQDAEHEGGHTEHGEHEQRVGIVVRHGSFRRRELT